MVRSDAAPAQRRPRLAVIEDDDLCRAELVEALGPEAEGFRDFGGFTAAGGDAGVVLLDLGLPAIDGFQAIEHLAARSPKPGLILISGSDHRLLAAAKSLAADLGLWVAGCYAKPVDAKAVVTAAEAALHRRRPESGGAAVPDSLVVQALADRRLHIEFQPKVDLLTGSWRAAEALLRLNHPRAGPIAPADVIRALQRQRATEALEVWLFQRVLEDLAQIRRDAPDFGIAINLPPESLGRRGLTDKLLQAIRDAGIAPAGVTVELLENGSLDLGPGTCAALARLRLHGLGVAIDDFGVGASNFDRLLRLPLTELKLDRSLVAEARASESARTMLGGSVRMANDRGIVATAEGIESEADHRLAIGLGCQLGQGYLFSAPLPLPGLLAGLRSRAMPPAASPVSSGSRRKP